MPGTRERQLTLSRTTGAQRHVVGRRATAAEMWCLGRAEGSAETEA
jgi:hypothetical protein